MLDNERELPVFEQPLVEEPQHSFTLPSAYYTDPAVYEREKTEIFYKTWQYVGH